MGVLKDKYEISVWSTESTKRKNSSSNQISYSNSSSVAIAIPLTLKIPTSLSAIDSITIINTYGNESKNYTISNISTGNEAIFANGFYGGIYESKTHCFIKDVEIIRLKWKELSKTTRDDGHWRFFNGLKTLIDMSRASGTYVQINNSTYSSKASTNSEKKHFIGVSGNRGGLYIHGNYSEDTEITITYPLLINEKKYINIEDAIMMEPGSNTITASYSIDGTSSTITTFYIPSYMKEYKICIIGSDSLNSEFRAIEPKFIENINGTHTFTFKMYYNINGEESPYIKYLFNEQRIKVNWKDDWYDLVIKNVVKSSSDNSVIYTCKDLYENELSKTGYNLIFDNELQNNQGTVEELGARVLESTEWTVETNNNKIVQQIDEPVYEVTVINQMTGVTNQTAGIINQSVYANATTEIPIPNTVILVYFSGIQSILDSQTESGNVELQFAYNPKGYTTELNSLSIIDPICYSKKLTYQVDDGANQIEFKNGSTTFFTVNYLDNVSTQYRAARLVNKTLTAYDPLIEKYVEIYSANSTPTSGSTYDKMFTSGDTIYHYTATEFDTPQIINNLFVNSEGFLNPNGWSAVSTATNQPLDLTTKLYPTYNGSLPYNGISYLKIPSNAAIYNRGLAQMVSFLPNGIQKGESYIFRYKAFYGNGKVPILTKPVTNITLNIVNISNKTSVSISRGTSSTSDGWREVKITFNQSLTRNQLLTGNYVFGLNTTTSFWLKEIQFFPLKYGYKPQYENGEILFANGEMVTKRERMNPGDMDFLSLSHITHFYYNHDIALGLSSKDDIKYIYKGEAETTDFNTLNSYLDPKTNDFNKIGTINISKSNRFNILQEIAQNFKCWCKFNISHNSNGEIIQRTVSFVEEVGNLIGYGFEYKTDLKEISRTIQSEQFVTKIIIPNNNNQFGKNGFCTITRSELNYAKTNYILNFDYYINHGFIDKEVLMNDLYDNKKGLGYFVTLRSLNISYDEISESLAEKRSSLMEQEAVNSLAKKDDTAITEQINTLKNDIANLAKAPSYEDEVAIKYIAEHQEEDDISSRLTTITTLQIEQNNNTLLLNSSESSIKALKEEIESLENKLGNIKNSIEEADMQFTQKYSTFIREGTWQDESYVDDDKYYLDGQEVAFTSSRPQVSYNISVLRLSALEDFEAKVFKIGDIAYVQDIDFFGYKADGITPYRELVVISEITSYFDEPDKDVITVQNYRTQFEDLFQRITASVQALQYNSGSYNRAAGAMTTGGALTDETIKKSFGEKIIVYSTQNENIKQDKTGITVSDLTTPNLKSWLSPTGLKITEDGGFNWKNVINGQGMETNQLKSGVIYTDKIMIMDGEQPSFRWNEEGITAYEPITGGGFNQNKFTRFDYFGLYGIDRNNGYIEAINRIYDDEKTYYILDSNENFIESSDNDFIAGITYYTIAINSSKIVEGFSQGTTYYEYNFFTDSYTETTDQNPVINKIYYVPQRDGDYQKADVGFSELDFDENWYYVNDNDYYFLAEDSVYDSNKTYKAIKISTTIAGVFDEGKTYYNSNYEPVAPSELPMSGNKYYLETSFNPSTLQEIKDSASYGLTWDGFFLRSRARNGENSIGRVEISSDRDFRVIMGNGAEEIERIVIGRLGDGLEPDYGIRINDVFGNAVLETGSDGNLWLKNALRIGNDDSNNPYDIKIGYFLDEDLGDIVFNANNNFIVKADGSIIANNGIFNGDISGASGNFKGEITASTGKIGGFVIGETTLSSISYNETTDVDRNPNKNYYILTENGYELKIFDDSDTYEEFANDVIYYEKQANLVLNSEEQSICANKILIDGKNSTITGDHFSITPDVSNFENVNISGKLSSTVFETNHIQAVGGAMIFKPSFKINKTEIIPDSNQYKLTLELNEQDLIEIVHYKETTDVEPDNTKVYYTKNDSNIYEEFNGTTFEQDVTYYEIDYTENKFLYGEVGQLVLLQSSDLLSIGQLRGVIEEIGSIEDEESSYSCYIKVDIESGMNVIDKEFNTLVIIGSDEDITVGINSNNKDNGYINGLLQPRGLTISKLALDDTGKSSFATHLFLGDFAQLDDTGLDNIFIMPGPGDVSLKDQLGYGLYADSVFLSGALVTAQYDSNGQVSLYAGVNTLSNIKAPNENYFPHTPNDAGNIIFWGGAEGYTEETIKKAHFFVTDKGNLYADSGYFTGTIITESTIQAAEIRTAKIYGTGVNEGKEGLILYDIAKGINFKKIVNSNEEGVFYIGTSGFYTDNGEPFISINNNTVNFDGNKFTGQKGSFKGIGIGDVITIDDYAIKLYKDFGDDISTNKKGGYFSVVNGTFSLMYYNENISGGRIILDDNAVEINNIENIYFGEHAASGALKFVKCAKGFDIYVL